MGKRWQHGQALNFLSYKNESGHLGLLLLDFFFKGVICLSLALIARNIYSSLSGCTFAAFLKAKSGPIAVFATSKEDISLIPSVGLNKI